MRLCGPSTSIMRVPLAEISTSTSIADSRFRQLFKVRHAGFISVFITGDTYAVYLV